MKNSWWRFPKTRNGSSSSSDLQDGSPNVVSEASSVRSSDLSKGPYKEVLKESDDIISPLDSDLYDPSGLKRGLQTRHLSLMALSGIIGPGLLVGAGQALNSGGPAALLIGFGVVGGIAACVMLSVGEMSTLYPTHGGFVTHTERFVNRPAAFVCGLNYFIVWIMVLANEYNAVSSVMTTWSTKVPIYGYFLLFWFAFSMFQLAGIRAYGEVEFWVGLFKIGALLAYFIFSIVYVSGGVSGTKAFGFHYFNDPGAFSTGFRGVAKVFIFTSTFYAGTESVAVAATEVRNPGRSVPRAIRQVFIRIVFVYLGSALFFGMTCPWNAPALTAGATKALQSPMTIAIQNAGWYGGYHLINALLLVTCISAINSSVYIGGRTILFMSKGGLLPKFFSYTTSWGVPLVAVMFTNLFGFLSLMNIDQGAAKAYNYIVNLSGVSTFIVWGIISLTHLRFRRSWSVQGNHPRDLPFRSKLAPWSTWVGLILNVFLALVQGWTTFSPFDAGNFVDAYILLPVSGVAYFAFAWWDRRLKWVKPAEIDLEYGRRSDIDTDDSVKLHWYQNI